MEIRRNRVMTRMLPRDTGLAIVRRFGASRGLQDPPYAMLPPEACVAYLDGEESCVMWPIRLQDTSAAIIEFMITRPGLSMQEARTLIRTSLTDIESNLLQKGVKLLLACTPHNAIVREATALGWEQDPAQSTHLSKPCCQS